MRYIFLYNYVESSFCLSTSQDDGTWNGYVQVQTQEQKQRQAPFPYSKVFSIFKEGIFEI